VLSDGRTDLSASHPGDLDPSTLHLGVAAPGGRMVDGVTVLVEPWPGYATLHLVLMAVDDAWRRRGVGASLVRAVQGVATSAGFDVWAAARTGALDFYAALGFHPLGDEFTGAMDLTHRRVLCRRRSRAGPPCALVGRVRRGASALLVGERNDNDNQYRFLN
jgi:GNAT superfamily N-acetyltransferase